MSVWWLLGALRCADWPERPFTLDVLGKGSHSEFSARRPEDD
jgi:hypothetical protein